MGETTDQIETYIDNKREDLGANLDELGKKMKSMTDWKHYFQTSPMTMIGIAFGGGVLVAAMLGGGKRRAPGSRSVDVASAAGSTTTQLKNTALETWDHIKGALIGVAASKAKEYIDEIVPGFEEQYDRTTKSGAY